MVQYIVRVPTWARPFYGSYLGKIPHAQPCTAACSQPTGPVVHQHQPQLLLVAVMLPDPATHAPIPLGQLFLPSDWTGVVAVSVSVVVPERGKVVSWWW